MEPAVLETATDRYVIRHHLAEGGMGAIYLGKKLGMNGFEKDVVFKQLLPEYTSDRQFIDLFLREARITASLDHANIVHTIDLVATDQDFFIVMEYVHGGDLRTLLRRAKLRGHLLSPQAVLYIGRCILDALSYAHGRLAHGGRQVGLIHRDISPSNILISGGGEVKLTDFGIAKASTQGSILYRVKGKVGYMSPEQARGEPVDHRADLFSLAVCLYEALVGERLFVGDLISTPSMIYSQPVRPPSRVRPGLPADLDTLFAHALAFQPEDRFQTADEFQEMLDRLIYHHGLAYSSSEMATHLRQVCGEVDEWRQLDVGTGPVTGTMLLDEDDAVRRSAITLVPTIERFAPQTLPPEPTFWPAPSLTSSSSDSGLSQMQTLVFEPGGGTFPELPVNLFGASGKAVAAALDLPSSSSGAQRKALVEAAQLRSLLDAARGDVTAEHGPAECAEREREDGDTDGWSGETLLGGPSLVDSSLGALGGSEGAAVPLRACSTEEGFEPATEDATQLGGLPLRGEAFDEPTIPQDERPLLLPSVEPNAFAADGGARDDEPTSTYLPQLRRSPAAAPVEAATEEATPLPFPSSASRRAEVQRQATFPTARKPPPAKPLTEGHVLAAAIALVGGRSQRIVLLLTLFAVALAGVALGIFVAAAARERAGGRPRTEQSVSPSPVSP